ncbi:hypothetical protein Anas_12657 [Armadillidium nasatum]|uniref:WAP domain-containing protein n=1 Tax=Armadillidium nasatum TaxID=96803 RepID=A0A5N5SII2_9CRUS|nr:hypothetical protein Anas_12657 [Armadillidium nasatum]
MKLFCGLCIFLFVFTTNFNEASSVPQDRYPDCVVFEGPCPKNYKPPPSCLLKRCPFGLYCCFDGCSYKCSLPRDDDFHPP